MTELRIPDPIRTYVEAFNDGDFERLLGCFTRNAIVHGVYGSVSIQAAVPMWRELYESMAVKLIPEDVAIDEPRIAVRFTETGCFRGPFRALAHRSASSETYTTTAMEWFALRRGKICECWSVRDTASIARQTQPKTFTPRG